MNEDDLETVARAPATTRGGTAVPGPDETLSAPAGAAAPVLPTIASETYEIRRELARGGMGRVLTAWDRRLGRVVAVKEALPDHPELQSRFEREALLTAGLQHPSIVTVYEAGRWPSGAPFYAMRLVSGESLEAVLSGARTWADRLRLLPQVIAVVEALAYAHSQGVIHRDLKPANVLVGLFGDTVVVDWGLAKRRGEEDRGQAAAVAGSDLTVTGSVMGTPAYMPPEQAAGEGVGERADVYALGAILYHVLTGQRPYAGVTSPRDLLRAVIEGPPATAESVEPAVPADLAAIVRKAMARDPGQRYDSAGGLAVDLQRFQTGQLVGAHRYSAREHALRFLRRHRLVVGVAAAAALLLAGFGVASVRRIREERDQAEHARGEAAAQRDARLLSQAQAVLATDPTEALALLREYPPSAGEWDRVRLIAADARSRGVATRVRHVMDDGLVQMRALPGGRMAVVGWNGRLAVFDPGIGTRERWDLGGSCSHRGFGRLALSADGRRAAVAGCAGTVELWDVPTRTRQVLSSPEIPFPIIGLDFSPDGRRLAVASGRSPLVVFDLQTREIALRGTVRTSRPVFSPDGRWLFAAGYDFDGPSTLWDLRSGAARTLPPRFDPRFSADGSRLVAHAWKGEIRTMTMDDGREGRVGDVGQVQEIAISPDGRTIVTAHRSGSVWLWPIAGGSGTELRGHQVPVSDVVFSADGRFLATLDSSGVVRLRDMASGSTRTLQARLCVSLAFSADGAWLVTGNGNGDVAVWATAPPDESVLLGHRGSVWDAQFSPDGRHLATAGEDKTLRIWDVARGTADAITVEDRVLGSTFLGDDLLVHSDGRRLVVREHGAVVATQEAAQHFAWFEAAADRRMVAAVAGPELYVFETATRAWRRVGAAEQVQDRCVVSADGTWVVTLDAPTPTARERGRQASLWNTRTGERTPLRGHGSTISSASFSPDGTTLATASWDGTVRLWRIGSGAAARVLPLDQGELRAVLFTPDGRGLAVATVTGYVALIDLASGTRKVLRTGGDVSQIAFAPGGRTLAVLGRRLVLWDVASGESREVGPADVLSWIAFSPDGSSLAATGLNGFVHVFRDDLPRDPGALSAWLARASDVPSPPLPEGASR